MYLNRSTSLEHSSIDGMPIKYLIQKLRKDGPEKFNNPSTAEFELHVEGVDRPFWVHKDFLISQSEFFNENLTAVRPGDLVKIVLPSPETFESILEYLYTGDDDKWYDTITPDNYQDICNNIDFLGLGSEIRNICIAYYQNNGNA
ncbi:10102_t:CDS:1 [Funneliformis geosporum]|uniref:4919_t:CDS:1 n=1 Tax=Funneliformis geosporum TaxID=1117311 RepID=A0A9W4WQ11_9GLOM|nr:10102_t:CDS:1 [Funneliformis geosporum]CAI2163354.1 4919_t:CDS:1 [Funneliformis geosporum]